jgi:LDH2 family malate/lactate/ureidoglycolate dehydrogenase
MLINDKNLRQSDGRYSADELITFSKELLQYAGLTNDRASIVAEALLEGDLMGHTTHGLELLPRYLEELESGAMTKEGNPEIVSDKELFMLLTCSDPSVQLIAPYRGLQPLYTPNPIAAGIPTRGNPIILDISTSCTASGRLVRLHKQGERLPHQWLLDGKGNPSDDPAVLFAEPPGSMFPLGGTDLGYKGYALGILVEALTAALSGHGRSDHPTKWGASVFLQLLDPQAFGGIDYFTQEIGWLAEACRSNQTKQGDPPVRLPGERALRLRAEQIQGGVSLYPTIIPALKPWAEKFGIPLPTPIA